MLVAQTTMGVARVVDDRFELLDVAGASLFDLVVAGAIERLSDSRVVDVLLRDAVTLRAPISKPGKIFIVGLNYEDHASEIGMEFPAIPRIHLTAASAVIGPGDNIPIPRIAPAAVDFEGEMAVIIGARASEVSVEQAWAHVAGITAANDVSARDVQNGSNPLVAGPNVGLAKGFDGFKPMGPALLTTQSLREGQTLNLRTRVDGEIRQDSNTAKMHFSVAELVSRISHYTTLDPGDVILTGTPGGVGASEGRFLRAGQLVEVELEGVGVLSNRLASNSQQRLVAA